MSTTHTDRIERLSTQELRRLERIYETGRSLTDSLILRGIRAELESRTEMGVDARGWPVIIHR